MSDKLHDDEHIEIPVEKARQGGRGTHVFVIWALSTIAVALGLFALYALNAAATGPA